MRLDTFITATYWFLKDLRIFKRFNVKPDGYSLCLPKRARKIFVDIYIRAGALSEGKQQAGVGHLLEHYIAGLASKALPGDVEFGAKINDDDIVFYLAGDDLAVMQNAAKILLETVTHPDFSHQDLFDHEKMAILNELGEEKNGTGAALERLIEGTRYRDEPDRRSFVDHLSSTQDLSIRDIAQHHTYIMTADTLKIFVSASGSTRSVQAVIKDGLRGIALPKGVTHFPTPEYSDSLVVAQEAPSISGVYAAVSFPAPNRAGGLKDRLVLDLMLAFIRDPDYRGVRQRVRERGVYDFQIVHKQGLCNGYIAIRSYLSDGQELSWVRMVYEYFDWLGSVGPEEDLFKLVKERWIRDMIFYWRSNEGRFDVLSECLMDQARDCKSLARAAREMAVSLSIEDIRQMARRIFDTEKSNIVLLGRNAKGVREEVAVWLAEHKLGNK